MEQNLSLFETRVLGCLFEKAVTTPDYYPLTSNGLLSACNQKSNREPVLEMTDSELQTTLDELNKKRLVTVESGFGSRVNKYAHRFCNTEFGELKISCQPVAINSGYVWPKKGVKISNKVITISILKPIKAGLTKEEFIKILENSVYEELNQLN